MKRHLPLAILRVILAGMISIILPFTFTKWGPEPPPQTDGPAVFGLTMVLCTFGMAVGTGYFLFGSIAQCLLRRKPVKWTLIIDLSIFAILSGILAYAAISARYV